MGVDEIYNILRFGVGVKVQRSHIIARSTAPRLVYINTEMTPFKSYWSAVKILLRSISMVICSGLKS